MRVAAVLLLAALAAGCAADPRYAQGLEWVLWNEGEKKRLEAQGFPQYSPGGGER